MPDHSPRIMRLGALALPVFLAACGGPEVTAYRVPKEPAIPPELADRALPATGAATAAAGGLTWTAPPGWEAKALTSMRRGSFTLRSSDGREADFSIIPFPGAAGGLLDNLNRWREQVALPPVTVAQLGDQIEHLDVGPLHFDIVDFAGQLGGVPTRITGAVLNYQGESWFFKLMGPDDIVRPARSDFLAFLQTVRPSP